MSRDGTATRIKRRGHFLCKASSWLLALCAAASVSAHTFFEGLVSMDINPHNQHLEIVHSYTTHDLTAQLMVQTQLAINLERPEHEALLRDYLAQHFSLRHQGTVLTPVWVGIRVTPQVVEIYQEINSPPPLNQIEVQNDVLQGAFANQVNRVNFSQQGCRGSLVFDRDTAKRQLIAAPCFTTTSK